MRTQRRVFEKLSEIENKVELASEKIELSVADDAKKIISLGCEKISISNAAIENPEIISDIAKVIGRQSIVVILDIKKSFLSNYSVWTLNGNKKYNGKFESLLLKLQDYGAGEIVVNLIDNDGVMQGYDLNLAEKVRSIVDIPITILGGAGSLDHIKSLIDKFSIIGAAAGSLFVFKGKYKAVLINYPNFDKKIELCKKL